MQTYENIFVALLTAARDGLMQDPPLQNLEHIKTCFFYLLTADRNEFRSKGILYLNNTIALREMLDKRHFSISDFVVCILTLQRAVEKRVVNYNLKTRVYVKKQVKFFTMLNYMYNKKSKYSCAPDKSFTCSETYKMSEFGKYYYNIRFDTSDDSHFYEFANENTKKGFSAAFTHLNTDSKNESSSSNHQSSSNNQSSSDQKKFNFTEEQYKNEFYEFFKEFQKKTSQQNDSSTSSSKTRHDFFDSKSFDFGNIFSTPTANDSNDLFPKRSGGQYSFTKPSVPFPTYKFCYGFEKESHYSILTDNQHLFDKEDLQFIQHSIEDNSTYTKPQLRRLLLKYHPDKNPVYSKVSAMLLGKCRDMLKKCSIM